MKIAINTCYGGFSLSEDAMKWMAARGHEEALVALDANYSHGQFRGFYPEDRAHPLLIEVIETLGAASWGRTPDYTCAELKVVEIPDGVSYTIEEYDGIEHIAEVHRTWR